MAQWVNIFDSANHSYDNTESELTATKTKDAIDELASRDIFLPSFFWEGTTTASQLMCHAVLPSAASFAEDLAGSYGYADVAADAETDFDVQHNGSSIGTIRWAAAANVPTFIAASPVSASAGHRIKIIGPATPDATLAGISVTLKMTRG